MTLDDDEVAIVLVALWFFRAKARAQVSGTSEEEQATGAAYCCTRHVADKIVTPLIERIEQHQKDVENGDV